MYTLVRHRSRFVARRCATGTLDALALVLLQDWMLTGRL